MFISVRRFEILDENLPVEELSDLVRGTLLPRFEEIDGFREYFLVETRDPRVTSVTICDSERAADEANRVSQAFVREAFGDSVRRIDLTQGPVLLAPSVLGHM